MSKWPMVRLGDVCGFLNGGTPSKTEERYYSGTIPLITGADILANEVTSARSFITQEAVNNSATNFVEKGTVLLVSRTGVGKVAIAGMDLCFSQDITAILPEESRLDKKYLCYFLKSKASYFKYWQRGATIQGITRDVIESVKIPLFPLSSQKRVAETLDNSQEIIDAHKKQLEELNNLIKATFYRMFGEPTGHKWERVFIDEVYDIIDGDRGVNYPKQEEFSHEGHCVFLNAGNVTIDGFNFDKLQYISMEKDNQLRTGKLVRNDIVFTTRGTVGNIAYYDSSIPFGNMRINSGMVLLRQKTGLLDPLFLCILFRTPKMIRYYNNFLSGTAQPQLPITNMRKIKIIKPPIVLQNKFAEIVTQIENQKSLVKQSLAESQNLFNSLMSRYFD
ncbi:MAG TPA: hypothetical protein DD734_12320 [Firmicutes bacterium]|nr:hypothetical protein [Pelotomaculum sp.]HBR35412.1 hypothetical protein [Bacillota bacterium]